jgi:hypothetical protein
LGEIEEKIKNAPNSFGRHFSGKMRPTTKNCAQTAKFCPIWSHWLSFKENIAKLYSTTVKKFSFAEQYG